MLIPLYLKNKRRIPFILGNTHISLKIRGVFRLYDPNRWILPYFKQLVGNLRLYLLLKPPLYTIAGILRLLILIPTRKSTLNNNRAKNKKDPSSKKDERSSFRGTTFIYPNHNRQGSLDSDNAGFTLGFPKCS